MQKFKCNKFIFFCLLNKRKVWTNSDKSKKKNQNQDVIYVIFETPYTGYSTKDEISLFYSGSLMFLKN